MDSGVSGRDESPTWLLQAWYALAYSDELGSDLVARTVCNHNIVCYRRTDGTPVALADRCPHRYLPLSRGQRRGDEIQCGYHGLRFNAAGACMNVPGQETIPRNAVVRCYPLADVSGLTWIWMGEAELADVRAIPDIGWFADGSHTTNRGYFHYAADYRLLVDNLLDLSHETFVHHGTIGGVPIAESPATAAIVDERVVRVHRMMFATEPPPYHARVAGNSSLIDRWHTSFYTPPSLVVVQSGSKPSGSNDESDVRARKLFNLLTPETATSTHYFWGMGRLHDRDDAEMTAFVQAGAEATLAQDKVVLEAQQLELTNGADPAFPVRIKVDAGPILGRRLLESLIAAEMRGVELTGAEEP